MKYVGSVRKEVAIRKHLGIFRKKISLWEAVALIVSGTIGAGILGMPYAIAQLGLIPGFFLIIFLGLLMMGLNLLLADVAIRTGDRFQLVGFAKKYLGAWGEYTMMIMFYTILFGALVVYVIGVGSALSALFGGSSFVWSLVFYFFASLSVVTGLRTVKIVELVLMVCILVVVVGIFFWSAPSFSLDNMLYVQVPAFFVPYGIILFAFHGTNAVPEAYGLLKHARYDFRRAICYAAIINCIVYCMFVFSVVAVTGVATTEIATVGLGTALGKGMLVAGNIFAVLAMATSFLLIALSFKDSLCWDYNMPKVLALVCVLMPPLVMFVLGMRGFVTVLSVVGGVAVSVEMLLILLIYLRARNKKCMKNEDFSVRYGYMLVCTLLLVLFVGALKTIIDIF